MLRGGGQRLGQHCCSCCPVPQPGVPAGLPRGHELSLGLTLCRLALPLCEALLELPQPRGPHLQSQSCRGCEGPPGLPQSHPQPVPHSSCTQSIPVGLGLSGKETPQPLSSVPGLCPPHSTAQQLFLTAARSSPGCRLCPLPLCWHWAPPSRAQPIPCPADPHQHCSDPLSLLSSRCTAPGLSACPHQEVLQAPSSSAGLSQQLPVCPEVGSPAVLQMCSPHGRAEGRAPRCPAGHTLCPHRREPRAFWATGAPCRPPGPAVPSAPPSSAAPPRCPRSRPSPAQPGAARVEPHRVPLCPLSARPAQRGTSGRHSGFVPPSTGLRAPRPAAEPRSRYSRKRPPSSPRPPADTRRAGAAPDPEPF